MKGRIAEVFDSIQGEGIYLGERQIFVRFFGCNLRCRFCDTRLRHFTEYEPEELFEELKLYQDDYHSISFTGGEPLLQVDFLREMLELTKQEGYKNYLETNGTLAGELEKVIDYLDIVAMDLKLPSSTEMGSLWGFHNRFLKVAAKKEVFLKTIICESTAEEDLIEALWLIRQFNQHLILVLQPNSYEDNGLMKEKIENFRYIGERADITTCVIPQVHRIIGIK